MLHNSHLVVNSPPKNQGSVLGHVVVACESCLELLVNIARWKALDRAMSEVRAELAALRATYESAPVDRNDEPLFALSVYEYCEAFPHLIVFSNDGNQVIGTCTQEEFLAALQGNVAKEDKWSPEAKERFRNYFLSDKEKLPLPCIQGIQAKYHLRPKTKVALPLVPSFDGEHRDYLVNQDAARTQKSFAGCDSAEIGYGHGAPLKGDRPEAFQTLNFAAMGDRERAWLTKDREQEPACLRGVESRFQQVTPEDAESQERGFAHVAGIGASNSAITRVLDVAKRLTFCPRCWLWCKGLAKHVADEAELLCRVQDRLSSKEEACLDCKGLGKLVADEAEKEAKREKTILEYCAEFKKQNDSKLAAKGWVGYSSAQRERLDSWLIDRAILISRGKDRTDPDVQKIDKVLREKYGIRNVDSFLRGLRR